MERNSHLLLGLGTMFSAHLMIECRKILLQGNATSMPSLSSRSSLPKCQTIHLRVIRYLLNPTYKFPFIQGCPSNSFAVHRSSGLHCNMHLTNRKKSSFFSPSRLSSDLSNVKPCSMFISAIQFPNSSSVSFRRHFGSAVSPSPSKNSLLRAPLSSISIGGGPSIATNSAR